MRTKILAAFIAGGLLVGAAFMASIVSSPATAQAQEQADDQRGHGPIPRILGFLEAVLNDLVGDGTITQNQADAIVEAAGDKAEDLKTERIERRELLSRALEDGVITEDEASELPDGHWLIGDRLDGAWEDGELTRREIRRAHPLRGHPFRRAMRFGAFLDDGGIDQSEYDSLGDDHLLKQIEVSEYFEDGLITPDEFREVLSDLMDARSGDDA